MHDLDRQQLEQYEQEGVVGEHGAGELNEAQEMELAAQFLEITTEAELEEFLGNLYQRAKSAAGSAWASAARTYNSPAVQRVMPVIKTSARIFGPKILGSIADKVWGGDSGRLVEDVAQIGADQLLNEELEGLSGEDREFEIARRYVCFAIEALRRALEAPARVPEPVAAQVALTEAARTHAPGIVPYVPELLGVARPDPQYDGGPTSGRWERRGSSIVVDLG